MFGTKKRLKPWALSIIFLIFCIAAGELALRFSPYPELNELKAAPYSRVVTDRYGRVLRIMPLEEGLRREYVPVDALSGEFIDVFLESEDKRFFLHRGVDGFAVIRSLVLNSRAGRVVSGASTIPMQLAGMISPREAALGGKLMEAWDALRIEARLSKREILELWLNTIPFGNQARGVGSGSRAYFNKPAYDLSLPEIAVLAVVPRHPEKYDPLENPEEAYRGALVNSRRLSVPLKPEELRRAVMNAERGGGVYHAPHFISRVADLSLQGDTVVTTLDLEVQTYLRERLYIFRERNIESRISGGAGLVLDNRSGDVIAYVGSIDYFSAREGEQIDGILVPRQPGSCLKPFLYAAALEEGWLPNALLPDIPMEFGGAHAYIPMNFNNSYSGPVRFRTALASSLNIPAVYLLNRIGTESFLDLLLKAGFETGRDKVQAAGLGAALGNLEVSLLELTRGFALFPRRGRPLKLNWIVTDADGDGGGERAVSAYTADLICDILSDPAERAPGFGYNSAFTLPFPVMFKTGTSDQFQNIWALAATPDYTVGIWMGNNTGQTVIGRTGSSLPARIAGEVLSFLQPGAPSFPVPADSEPVRICSVSGQKATELCPVTVTEYFPNSAGSGETLGSCSFHTLRDGGLITEYPEEYHAWLGELGRTEEPGFSGDTGIKILHPLDGSVFYLDPSVPPEEQAVRIEALSGFDGSCFFYVNGRERAFSGEQPHVWFFPLQPGSWEISVANDYSSDSIRIEVR